MLEVTVDLGNTVRRYGRIRRRVQSVPQRSELYERIRRDHRNTSREMFRVLAKGGRYRGVYWPWFSPNYKIRPSGKRVTRASNLLRDTGLLYASVATQRRDRRGRLTLITPVDYAVYHNNDPLGGPGGGRRPFSFFTRSDVRKYTRWTSDFLLGR